MLSFHCRKYLFYTHLICIEFTACDKIISSEKFENNEKKETWKFVVLFLKRPVELNLTSQGLERLQ